MKLALISGGLIASLVPLIAWQAPSPSFAADPPCSNLLTHEPIVIFDVTGSTVSPLDVSLTVFNDGWVKLAVDAGAGRNSFRTVQLQPAVTGKLQQQLVELGTLGMCDDDRAVTDAQLHTVTLLSNEQNPRGHTFSYWTPDAGFARVDAVLEQFIEHHFPVLTTADDVPQTGADVFHR